MLTLCVSTWPLEGRAARRRTLHVARGRAAACNAVPPPGGGGASHDSVLSREELVAALAEERILVCRNPRRLCTSAPLHVRLASLGDSSPC